MGRDLQRRRPAAAGGLGPNAQSGAAALRGDPDADDAGEPEPGVDRPRRHAGAAVRDLSRTDGISRADSPKLAGQYAAVIYKQLWDFRSGARTNAVMSPFAVNLTDQEIADLASYYAYLPRLPAYHPTPQLPKPRIVIYGAPVRGIAPCGSCDGSLDNKTGSPWLEGQSEAYMKAQLRAFATSQRTNDICQQMRNIARAMTLQEIDGAAAYYASQPPEIVKATD